MNLKLSFQILIFTLLFSLLVHGLEVTPTQTHLAGEPSSSNVDDRERPGCNEIDQETKKCIQCKDSACTSINQDGFCVCEHDYERPNSETGICEPCYIPGCASCQRGQDMTCAVCLDPKAVLQNGICSCPAGQELDNDGKCHQCGVKGCNECQAGSTNTCKECIDESAELKDGKCDCPEKNQTLNFFGYCSYCLVKGCDECTWSATECHKCLDAEANLIDGECQCPVDKPMNNDGQCQECAVSHCSACMTGDKDKCDCCEQGFDLVNGRCECPENQVEKDGKCHPSVPCCVEYENGVCTKTKPDTVLVDGKCICAKNDEKIDENGQCVNCQVVGCEECNKPDDCSKCVGDLVLKDGECGCPEGQSLRPDKTCSSDCTVSGCKKCDPNSNQVCIQCSECDMQLVDGKCVCTENNEKPNENGECSLCFTSNCLQCNCFNNQKCNICQQGYNLKEGKCEKEETTPPPPLQVPECQGIIGCQNCLQSNGAPACYKCGENFFLTLDRCEKKCDASVSNCMYCEFDDITKCKKCNLFYTLRDFQCYPPV